MDYEIGFFIDSPLPDPDSVFEVVVTNHESGITERYVADPDDEVNQTTCHWVAHLGPGDESEGEQVLEPDVRYTIAFDLYMFESDIDEGRPPVETHTYTYYYCNDDGDAGSFYCPYGRADSYPDLVIGYTGLADSNPSTFGEMRAFPTRLAPCINPNSGEDVGDFFSDRSWVMPFYAQKICDQTGYSLSTHRLRNVPFFTPQEGPTYALNADFDFDVPPGRVWNWSASNVAQLLFPTGSGLVVEGTLDVEGVTFTAADPADGWHGIRFEPGATGSLQGLSQSERLVVSEVNGYGASVYVDDAEVALDLVELNGRPQGSDFDIRVSGIFARGSRALVNVSNTTITDHTDYAIRVSSGARVYASNNVFSDHVLSYGATGGADVFLWENESPRGVSAQSYGTVWLGPPEYSYVPPAENNDFGAGSASAVLLASNHGEVWAGVQEDGFSSNNHLFRTGSARGYATAQQYSDVTARYNWWGDAAGPDLALASTDASSAFDYCPWLTDPTSGTTSTCVLPRQAASFDALSASVSNGQARGDGGPPPVPPGAAGHLWRAREAVAHGRYGQALGRLRQAAQEAGPGEEGRVLRRRALRLFPPLLRRAEAAGHGQAVAQALVFLTERAQNGSLWRPFAVRALAEVAAARGDHAEALALAEVLVAEGEEHVVTGQVMRAFALASLGDTAAAEGALAMAEAAAPGDEEVAWAREELALWLGRPVESGARGSAGSDPVAAGRSTSTSGMTHSLSVYPNPTDDAASIALTLAEVEEVRVVVYDVLGRTVATLAEGRFEAGPHRLALDAGALPAGVYVVRATAGSHVSTRRLTVVR